MGKGYRHGSEELSYGLQIVGGTTRPKNPTQCMVWANTPNEITSVYLAGEKPKSPVAGGLWVKIGDSGSKKIGSPVSKEWITVYPLSAEQYISGEWVSIEVMSYQDGEWVGVVTLFYDKDWGYTGNWLCYPYKANSVGSYIGTVTPTIEDVENGIKITTPGKAKVGLVVNDELYNFDGVKNIKVTYTAPAMSSAIGNFNVSIIDKIANSFTFIAQVAAESIVGNSVTIDLPCNLGNMQGYVGIGIWSGDNGDFSFVLERIELER